MSLLARLRLWVSLEPGLLKVLTLVQAENEALQLLVMEVAQNKQDAQRKVSGLKQRYSNLLAKVKMYSCDQSCAVRHIPCCLQGWHTSMQP